MGDSDWDSEPEEQHPRPPLSKNHNGVGRAGDRRLQKSQRAGDGGREVTLESAGDRAAPCASPRGGTAKRQPTPKQRNEQGSQPRPEREPEPEPEPPFNLRSEMDGHRASRSKPRAPGLQHRSEYTVSCDQTPQSPTTDDWERQPLAGDDTPSVDRACYSPSRPRPPLPMGGDKSLVDWDCSSQRRPRPHLAKGNMEPDTAASRDPPLKPVNSSGSMKCSNSADRPQSPVVQEPMSEIGPLAVSSNRYQFSQGNLRTLSLGDHNPSRLLERYGKAAFRRLMRGWAELFWVLSVPVLLVTTFLYSLLRFILQAVVRPVTVGPLQLIGDHLLKPAAVALHDSLLLPAATLLANVVSALVLVAGPLSQLLEALLRPLATVLASVRLVHVSYGGAPAQQVHTQTV